MSTDANHLRDIVRETADVYRITPDDITGRRRDRLAFAARSEVIAWAISNGFSYAFVSQYFRRDRTSITNALMRYEAQAVPVPGFRSRRLT